MRKFRVLCGLGLLLSSAGAFASGFCGSGDKKEDSPSLSIEERMADCRMVYGSASTQSFCDLNQNCFQWTLVSHQPSYERGKSAMLWRDDTTGVIWGSAALENTEYVQALRFCQDYKVGASASSQYGKKWKAQLPSAQDLVMALEHQIQAVPRLSGTLGFGRWWTSEVESAQPFKVKSLSSNTEEWETNPFTLANATCVVKPLIIVVK